MTKRTEKIAVLGGGSWGIAISILIHKNGYPVRLWEHFKDECRLLRETRQQPDKLPGVEIPAEIEITNDMTEALADVHGILVVVPSHVFRDTVRRARNHLAGSVRFIVSLAKGIENNSLCRMSEVLLQELPEPFHASVAALSGPSHAEEVSVSIPTTVVVAANTPHVAELIQDVLTNSTFRVYTSSDLIGVELGGSLKNVIAIAAGISHGLGLGDNTMGALVTRGLAEMVRLGTKMGADPMTFAGLSGIGDLITTCTSRHSRNRYVGEQLGKGRQIDDIVGSMKMVAEGVKTTKSAYQMSLKYGVDMPMTAEVYQIIFEGKDPAAALYNLMSRPPKPEVWS